MDNEVLDYGRKGPEPKSLPVWFWKSLIGFGGGLWLPFIGLHVALKPANLSRMDLWGSGRIRPIPAAATGFLPYAQAISYLFIPSAIVAILLLGLAASRHAAGRKWILMLAFLFFGYAAYRYLELGFILAGI